MRRLEDVESWEQEKKRTPVLGDLLYIKYKGNVYRTKYIYKAMPRKDGSCDMFCQLFKIGLCDKIECRLTRNMVWWNYTSRKAR